MNERPILFSTPMVQALRAERKTQTRRTRGLDKINEAPDAWVVVNNEFDRVGFVHFRFLLDSRDDVCIRCPYGFPGDRLWTRETFALPYVDLTGGSEEIDKRAMLCFRADGPESDYPTDRYDEKLRVCYPPKWAPSIHMPRWASRDTLEVISARPERLHDMTRADAYAEGTTAGDSFPNLWDSINGPGSWAKNLWVWRVEFRRIS